MIARGSNAGEAPPEWLVNEDRAAAMAAFDALPPPLRRRLANATVDFGVLKVASLVDAARVAGMPARDFVPRILDLIAQNEALQAEGPLPAGHPYAGVPVRAP